MVACYKMPTMQMKEGNRACIVPVLKSKQYFYFLKLDVIGHNTKVNIPLYRRLEIPICNLCDKPTAQRQSADGPFMFTITYRRKAAKKK
jgi:hypothetical protein